MSYPATTPAQAQALLKRAEFAPFMVYIGGQGFVLTARLVEYGLRPACRQVGDTMKWVDEPSFGVVFSGGKWGPHSLPCTVSSPERILAHWDGYKAAHVQAEQRRAEASKQPAGAVHKRPTWTPKVGDKVFFPRGMFGRWAGRIERLYEARGSLGIPAGTPLADIRCIGANGRVYRYKRCQVKYLTHQGLTAAVVEVA